MTESETPMCRSAFRPVILHLAVEYNTPLREKTTTAVEWFVDELVEVDNVIVAMKRVANPLRTYLVDCGKVNGHRLFAFGFFGLPFGIGLAWSMRAVAARVMHVLKGAGIRPDLVHAHKLTFEGIAGWHIAQRLGAPLFVSVRGEVESKVFRFKPSYRALFRRILFYARRIYYVSAWFQPELRARFGVPSEKEELLPNIVRNTRPTIVTMDAGRRFVSVCNLDIHRKKGLHWLLAAFAQVVARDPSLRLDVIGGGRKEAQDAVRAQIEALGLNANVTLVGPLSNDELLRRLPSYLGLVLPSVNETFGMVYVEALFAGIPIIYTKKTGIDGYLDGLDVGISVPAGDVTALEKSIARLAAENAKFRQNIQRAADELFHRFDKTAYVARYIEAVRCAVIEK